MKRLVDIIGATVGLVLFAPLLAYLALRIRREMGSPVLFRQIRPGRHGKPFTMIKLRTMRDATDAKGTTSADAERLTPLGRFLRSSSLDELPELINVLRGEMSICGPRPLLMQYLPLYTPEQARRHEVKPGITGWAQVNGHRGETEQLEKMEARIEFDLDYLRNWTLKLDLAIIARTVLVVLNDKQAY